MMDVVVLVRTVTEKAVSVAEDDRGKKSCRLILTGQTLTFKLFGWVGSFTSVQPYF